MKRLLAFLLLLATPTFADQRTGTLALDYDLDATSYTYCILEGQGGVYAGPRGGNGRIETTGSSTSVTETTVGSDPFTNLAAGDVLFVAVPGERADVRAITTRTDAANVVVTDAVDWTGGFAFRWKKSTCGTAATNGWFSTVSFHRTTIAIEYKQGDLTGGLDWIVECKKNSPNSQATDVASGNIPTAEVGTVDGAEWVVINADAAACRVGLKAGSGDSSDATTDLEKINVDVTGFITGN